jgi:hypothetical protein
MVNLRVKLFLVPTQAKQLLLRTIVLSTTLTSPPMRAQLVNFHFLEGITSLGIAKYISR